MHWCYVWTSTVTVQDASLLFLSVMCSTGMVYVDAPKFVIDRYSFMCRCHIGQHQRHDEKGREVGFYIMMGIVYMLIINIVVCEANTFQFCSIWNFVDIAIFARCVGLLRWRAQAVIQSFHRDTIQSDLSLPIRPSSINILRICWIPMYASMICALDDTQSRKLIGKTTQYILTKCF